MQRARACLGSLAGPPLESQSHEHHTSHLTLRGPAHTGFPGAVSPCHPKPAVSGVAIGTSGNATLERTTRVHANFAEYVPFALLLMLLVELSGYRPWLVHLLGIALVAGRCVHAWGVSQAIENYRLRVTGVALTFMVLTVSALLLLAAAVGRII